MWVPMQVGWIGVGRMGMQMVIRLLKVDYHVAVWNRMALMAGVKLQSENVPVSDGLEPEPVNTTR